MSDSLKKRRTVSGFTLIEMIVVIAIIGILIGVLVPTMSSYMTRSRLNTANANAKVIFNSIQTVCQELEFKERNCTSSEFYGSISGTDEAQKEGRLVVFCENGHVTVAQAYSMGSSGVGPSRSTALTTGILNGDTSNTDVKNAMAQTPNPDGEGSCFVGRLNRLISDFSEISWIAVVENYQVRLVLAADTPDVTYVGGYPVKGDDRGQFLPSGATDGNLRSFVPVDAFSDVGFAKLEELVNQGWQIDPSNSFKIK